MLRLERVGLNESRAVVFDREDVSGGRDDAFGRRRCGYRLLVLNRRTEKNIKLADSEGGWLIYTCHVIRGGLVYWENESISKNAKSSILRVTDAHSLGRGVLSSVAKLEAGEDDRPFPAKVYMQFRGQ